MRKRIVYAHGFRSASRSVKALQLAAYVAQHHIDVDLVTPDLSFDPAVALDQLSRACAGATAEELVVIGSSLGGFYAAVLAEKTGCRAMLLNPSIRPFVTLEKYLGTQTNMYTGETFAFTRQHITALREVFVPRPTRPSRMLLIVETGDEVLDYREAVQYCEGATQIVVEGGDHALQSFIEHIPAVLEFSGIALR